MPRAKKQQTPQESGPLDSFVEREVVQKKTRGPVRKTLSPSTAAVPLSSSSSSSSSTVSSSSASGSWSFYDGAWNTARPPLDRQLVANRAHLMILSMLKSRSTLMGLQDWGELFGLRSASPAAAAAAAAAVAASAAMHLYLRFMIVSSLS